MKLSIITINFNNRDGLRKTIDSVVSQTWQDFEWIIVDGGSTDGSRELIEETAAKLESQGWTTEQFSGPEDPASYIANHQSPILNPSSPHRLLWCSEKDKGIYNAMNKGIVKAQGEYCLFLNSGDSFFEDDILHVVLTKGDNGMGMIIGRVLNDKGIGSRNFANSRYSASHLLEYPYPHQACFISKVLFKKYGLYNEEFRTIADWVFYIDTIILSNEKVQFMPYYIARVDSNGISANSDFYKNEILKMKQKMSVGLVAGLEVARSYETVISSVKINRFLFRFLYRISMLCHSINKEQNYQY